MPPTPEPQASPLVLPSAFADAALLAVHRSLSLHATLMQDCLELGLARARRAATDPVGAMRESMLSPALAEPVWRWAGGLAAIGPQALLTWAAAASPDPARSLQVDPPLQPPTIAEPAASPKPPGAPKKAGSVTQSPAEPPSSLNPAARGAPA
ncbi:MAG: hypothetical protein WCK28_21860, partial [Burkholderiales bacterium]